MKNQGHILLTLLETEGLRLQGVLFKLTLREEAVEELMQDLFLNLYQSDGFAGVCDPVAYTYRLFITPNLKLTPFWFTNPIERFKFSKGSNS